MEEHLWLQLPFAPADNDDDDARSDTVQPGPFSKNALLFLQEWLAVRRKGQDFSQSMVGLLVRGRRLEEGTGEEGTGEVGEEGGDEAGEDEEEAGEGKGEKGEEGGEVLGEEVEGDKGDGGTVTGE